MYAELLGICCVYVVLEVSRDTLGCSPTGWLAPLPFRGPWDHYLSLLSLPPKPELQTPTPTPS